MEVQGQGFVAIADNKVEEPIDAGRGGPGNYAPFDETLYESSSDSWDAGPEVGSASGFTLRTPGFLLYQVVLDLLDGRSFAASGRLNFDTSPKAGVIPVTGGGRLKVEFKNPKRYTYTP